MDTIRIGNRDYGLVKCLTCGKPRYRRMLYVKKFQFHFCSKRCVITARRRGMYGKPLTSFTTKCSICGNMLVRKQSERSSSGKYFCCAKCRSDGIKQSLVGRNPIRSNNPKAGRARARRLYPNNAPCEVCGKPNAQRHHVDGNTQNNLPINIRRLCPKHHIHADRMDHMKKISKIGAKISISKAKRDCFGKFIHR